MTVVIKEIAPMHLLAMRHIGPYHQIGSVFDLLNQFAAENDVSVLSTIAIWHDDPSLVPASELKSDACLVVPFGFTISSPGITMLDVPGGEYAVADYYGSYDGLVAAWSRFFGELLPATGRVVRDGVEFEKYVGDCDKVPAAELLTELYIPVV